MWRLVWKLVEACVEACEEACVEACVEACGGLGVQVEDIPRHRQAREEAKHVPMQARCVARGLARVPRAGGRAVREHARHKEQRDARNGECDCDDGASVERLSQEEDPED